ncbi:MULTISPECIES: hypothetical protein [Colwellia]|uniref:hypothetical protein n=1 Tax=Colwellia TaxID=28228 RepID=UPI00070D8B53|nr:MULTISPECIES: hypothetical protein [Colwellia]
MNDYLPKKVFLKLKGAGELSLSVNDQLSLTAPNGNMALGKNYQENGLFGSYPTCCEFNFNNTSNQPEPAKMSFEELQDNQYLVHGIQAPRYH